MSKFYKQQPNEIKNEYKKFLVILGGLSRLFSESSEPYLYYRAHENLFCKVFEAINHSRSDISFDASKDNAGIGLKTFLQNNGRTFQKIAEFNADSNKFRNVSDTEIVNMISKLRNDRLEFALNLTKCSNMFYHVITRENSRMNLVECEMDYIKTTSLKVLNSYKNTINFSDTIHEYSFSKSKNTLSQRFITQNPIESIDVPIHNDPFLLLEQIDFDLSTELKPNSVPEYIILPLYSSQDGDVHEKSGLNQWNANGRQRNSSEVYIPIPSFIHKKYPNFFDYDYTAKATKDSPSFYIQLPNGKRMKCKVAQQGGKALMSDPNKDLGEWILRDVLKLPEKQLVTRKILDKIGIDSVRLTKLSESTYSLDFTKTGSFEIFANSKYIPML
jgi:hypothetical protein